MINLSNLGIFLFYKLFKIFRNTLFSTWKVNNKVAGYRKQVGLYEIRTVNNAGHLVPMDQGPAASQLVKDFVSRSVADVQEEEQIEVQTI
jgi:hypothetical protein